MSELDDAVYHYEDYDESCPGEAGWITGHPELVTCPECLHRLSGGTKATSVHLAAVLDAWPSHVAEPSSAVTRDPSLVTCWDCKRKMTQLVHKGCGGDVIDDRGTGFMECLKCHAQDYDDREPGYDADLMYEIEFIPWPSTG